MFNVNLKKKESLKLIIEHYLVNYSLLSRLSMHKNENGDFEISVISAECGYIIWSQNWCFVFINHLYSLGYTPIDFICDRPTINEASQFAPSYYWRCFKMCWRGMDTHPTMWGFKNWMNFNRMLPVPSEQSKQEFRQVEINGNLMRFCHCVSRDR